MGFQAEVSRRMKGNMPLMTMAAKPEVGMGVTIGVGSDRYAGTITRVSPSGKRFWYTEDECKLVEGSAQSEQQVYEYTTVPDAAEHMAKLNKLGKWKNGGAYVSIGGRRAYRDPSF